MAMVPQPSVLENTIYLKNVCYYLRYNYIQLVINLINLFRCLFTHIFMFSGDPDDHIIQHYSAQVRPIRI